MAKGAREEIVIRDATVDDAEAIERVRMAGWRATYQGLVPQSYLDGLRLDAEAIAARRRQMARNPPDVRSLVSLAAAADERDAAVAGFVVYGPDRGADQASDGVGDRPGRVGEVYAIYVHPDTQSRGHGRALLGRAARGLAGAGYTRAGLWVLEGNAQARAFYERFGMAATGERKWYEVGGTRVPEIRYEMSLPA